MLLQPVGVPATSSISRGATKWTPERGRRRDQRRGVAVGEDDTSAALNRAPAQTVSARSRGSQRGAVREPAEMPAEGNASRASIAWEETKTGGKGLPGAVAASDPSDGVA